MDRNFRTRTIFRFPSVSAALGFLTLACVIAAWVFLDGRSAEAQESVRSIAPATTPGPMASFPQPMRLPNVPMRDPRPAEGDALGERWETRLPPNTPPTAGFIEPLRGNDAVIQVVVGQSRLLTLRKDLISDDKTGVIAVSDPTVVDFDVMPNPRLIRLIARRAGVTDLSIMTARGDVYNFEVHVIYDLELLNAQLTQIYPDLQLRLFQLRDHLVVEGQVRSIRQADQVLKTIELFLASAQASTSTESQESNSPQSGGRKSNPGERSEPGQTIPPGADPPDGTANEEGSPNGDPSEDVYAEPEPGGRPNTQATLPAPQIINLLRVPGVHQVMLRVQIAELNRTALRNIGADWNVGFNAGSFLETLVGGPATTVAGVFPSADLEFVLRALRQNSLLSILAEPNLVAMSGQPRTPVGAPQSPSNSSSSVSSWTLYRTSWKTKRSG